MAAQSKVARNPTQISRRMSSSPIVISSDPPSAPELNSLLLAQADNWPPIATNRPLASENPPLDSRATSAHPSRASRSSISTSGFPLELELELLQARSRCGDLEAENERLRAQLEILQ